MGPIERELRSLHAERHVALYHTTFGAFRCLVDASRQLLPGATLGWEINSAFNESLGDELFSEAIEAAEALGL